MSLPLTRDELQNSIARELAISVLERAQLVVTTERLQRTTDDINGRLGRRSLKYLEGLQEHSDYLRITEKATR